MTEDLEEFLKNYAKALEKMPKEIVKTEKSQLLKGERITSIVKRKR